MCTPAMIMTGKALLDENPQPSDQEAREAISGNFCGRTGYTKIVEAIVSVPGEGRRGPGREAQRYVFGGRAVTCT